MDSLFKISFLHRYFSDGKLAGARVLPDSSTRQLMDRYRLMPRLQDGVFGVYTDSRGGAQALIAYLDGQLESGVLTFFLYADEQQFFFITDVPLDWVGQLELSSSVAKKTTTGQFDLQPALSSDGAGLHKAIAIISIHLHDLLLMESTGVQYVVDFPVRKVGWCYYLVNRSEYVLKDPAVIGSGGQLFERSESMLLSTGDHAWVFSSGQQSFFLQQAPSLIFNLVDRVPLPLASDEKAIEHVLIKGLPAPKQDHLSAAHTAGSPHAVCAMHVYL